MYNVFSVMKFHCTIRLYYKDVSEVGLQSVIVYYDLNFNQVTFGCEIYFLESQRFDKYHHFPSSFFFRYSVPRISTF